MPVRAMADMPSHGSVWSACSVGQVEYCVELLEHTVNGSTQSYGAAAQPQGEAPSGPAVRVMTVSAGGFVTLNAQITTPELFTHSSGVATGLDDGVWRIVIRTGTFDPTLMGIQAQPVDVSVEKESDGTFRIDVSAQPAPLVGVDGPSFVSCAQSNWGASCEPTVAIVRNISLVAATHPGAPERDAVRGSWIATNASMFSSPTINMAARSISAQAAGPHYVPVGFPTTGLVAEGERHLNPGFYKAFVPWSVLTVMLDRVPAELKTLVTPDKVKATIAEQASRLDVSVTLSATDAGLAVTLPVTHFSAPNPQIVFSALTNPAGSTTTTTPTATKPSVYRKGKSATVTSIVKVPKGFKVSRVVTSTKKVCTASGSKVKFVGKGKCTFAVTSKKGRKVVTTKKTVTVS